MKTYYDHNTHQTLPVTSETINSTEFPRAKKYGWDKEVDNTKRDIELAKKVQKTVERNKNINT